MFMHRAAQNRMQALSTTPSIASSSTTTDESEQLKQLRSENKALHKDVLSASTSKAITDALHEQERHWQRRFDDVVQARDHWMRTAQPLMQIKPTKKASEIGASGQVSPDPGPSSAGKKQKS